MSLHNYPFMFLNCIMTLTVPQAFLKKILYHRHCTTDNSFICYFCMGCLPGMWKYLILLIVNLEDWRAMEVGIMRTRGFVNGVHCNL